MSGEDGAGVSTSEKVNTMTSVRRMSNSTCEPLKPSNPYKRDKKEPLGGTGVYVCTSEEGEAEREVTREEEEEGRSE